MYLGSPTWVNGDMFSHGGSGFILSGPALARFAEDDEGVAARYDEALQHEMYGDYMMTKALRDKGIKLSPVSPMIQSGKPANIPFGAGPDTASHQWCQPIITMHHITPTEASQIWAFEQRRRRRDRRSPLLIRDVYEGLVAAEMRAERDDWYNLSDDVLYRAPGVHGDRQKADDDDDDDDDDDVSAAKQRAYLSFEHCRAACEEQARCWQFVYYDRTCGVSHTYRLGERREPTDEGTAYKSGWAVHKIARDRRDNPCHAPAWVLLEL